MVNPGFDAFVGQSSTPLFIEPTGNKKAGELLWGDGVHFLGQAEHGRVPVRARGRARSGWIEEAALEGGKSLLEIYFIDVGQGDGVLLKTPDFRHIMIDGGHPRASQNTGKSGADFVDWKFFEDYGLDHITLDAMIASHNDFDHFGGLADLLDTAQEEELDAKGVAVEAFYHAGVSWWKDDGERTLGKTTQSDGVRYLTQLLGNRPSAERATVGSTGPQLQGKWGEFIAKVVEAKRTDGQPTPVERLSQLDRFLPGFEPGSGVPTIHVLGPIEYKIDGAPALLSLGSDSQSTNGNSILLRVDYGRCRILLTGDLNKASQQALLDAYQGRRLEFQCDVAKACHHGSEDVSFSFLQAMAPAATIISSGDHEGHDHPRPRIVAASGATGHLQIENDEIITPLVYSTELARSVSIGHPTALHIQASGAAASEIEAKDFQSVSVDYLERKPGGLRPSKKIRKLSNTKIVAGLIYGLVNVRTDGSRILTATMNEGDGSWSIKQFKSRF